MRILANGKVDNQIKFVDSDDWPQISIMLSAYNEEDVIQAKVKSLTNQNYNGIVNIYIGSDRSDDATNSIVSELANSHKKLFFFPFPKRKGKPAVINALESIISKVTPRSDNHIYIITDANVILNNDVLKELVAHFKNERIALVDSNMIYTGLSDDGISKSENTYLNKEVLLKNYESRVFHKMIGPFGGCYAFRSSFYKAIPENFLVDDYYMAMSIFEQGGQAINALTAKCFEPVSHKLSQEFKRKKRISAGNYQNLFRFRKLLNPFSSLGFSIMSHKVLRWKGPFFLLSIILSALYLSLKGYFLFQFIFGFLIIWFLAIPAVDFLLTKMGIHVQLFRSINYFNLMNLALAFGFFKFLSGVKKGTWERTERSQVSN